MFCRTTRFGLALSAIFVAAALGCNQKPPSATADSSAKIETEEEHRDDIGPNGGPAVVLGNHEYHAELLHNEDSGEVSVSITNAKFRPIRVAEKELFLTAVLNGKQREFTLLSDAKQTGASRFVLVDKHLCGLICKGAPDGVRLNVTLNEKPYGGTFSGKAHEHKDGDHGDHDEKHTVEHGDKDGHQH